MFIVFLFIFFYEIIFYYMMNNDLIWNDECYVLRKFYLVKIF